jgi:hypothetical protein
MGVHSETGHVHCFRCGFRGRLEGEDFQSPTPESSNEGNAVSAIPPPEGFVPLGEEPGSGALTFQEARDYLLVRRKVPLPSVRRMRVGACAEGWYAGRIVVPVLDDDGETWLGYVARLWADPPRSAEGAAALKYLYPKGMRRGQILYNRRVLDTETDVPVLVVEGVFDALAFPDDAVALLGTCSEAQTELLKAAKRPIAIVLDGDAWEKGHMLAARLQFDGLRAGCVRLPPGADPDEVPREALIDATRRSIGKFDPVPLHT